MGTGWGVVMESPANAGGFPAQIWSFGRRCGQRRDGGRRRQGGLRGPRGGAARGGMVGRVQCAPVPCWRRATRGNERRARTARAMFFVGVAVNDMAKWGTSLGWTPTWDPRSVHLVVPRAGRRHISSCAPPPHTRDRAGHSTQAPSSTPDPTDSLLITTESHRQYKVR